MKSSRILYAGLAALLVTACAKTARIDAEVAGAPSSDIVVKQLNVSRYDVLDTVKTDASGRMSVKVSVEKGNPEFFYLYYKDSKIASLLLERGDRVKVSADTLGNYAVEGSEESVKLSGIESRYAGFSASLDSLSEKLLEVGVSSPEAKDVNAEIANLYMDYYRGCVRYVLENSHSLTVIPVFWQTVGNSFYVFSQDTDAIIFKNVCDSLKTEYPDSKYVKSLRNEAERRTSALQLNLRLKDAASIGFPDIELPDVTGKKVKLSSVEAKVILLHFWSASDAAQKMFNLDVLKGVYDDFHSRGLEIYQVAIDVDKPSWERTVAAQGLKWINVCDGLGTNSPVVSTYNVSKLPVSYIIADGQMTGEKVSDEASLRRVLNKLL